MCQNAPCANGYHRRFDIRILGGLARGIAKKTVRRPVSSTWEYRFRLTRIFAARVRPRVYRCLRKRSFWKTCSSSRCLQQVSLVVSHKAAAGGRPRRLARPASSYSLQSRLIDSSSLLNYNSKQRNGSNTEQNNTKNLGHEVNGGQFSIIFQVFISTSCLVILQQLPHTGGQSDRLLVQCPASSSLGNSTGWGGSWLAGSRLEAASAPCRPCSPPVQLWRQVLKSYKWNLVSAMQRWHS